MSTSQLNLVRFGYASGNYGIMCLVCGQPETADKRATTCERCAEKLMKIARDQLADEIYGRGCGQIADYDQSIVADVLQKPNLCVQEMADILIYGDDK